MSITKIIYSAVVMALATGLFWIKSASAEFMDCSYSEEYKGQPTRDVLWVTNDRRLVQWTYVTTLSSKNPEFNGIQVTVYEQWDDVGGTGTVRGYAVYALKSGEKLWIKYEGQYWGNIFQGVFHFIAGTGKYKAIRGVGHYQGKSSTVGFKDDVACDAVY